MRSGGGLGIQSKVVHGQPADRRGRTRRHQRIFQVSSPPPFPRRGRTRRCGRAAVLLIRDRPRLPRIAKLLPMVPAVRFMDGSVAAAAAAAGMDFVERLGPDASAAVFAVLLDRADIARTTAVSRSWRTLVMVVHRSKIRCLRLCPEVASITRIEQEQPTNSASSSNNGVNEGDAGSTAAAAAWENYKIEQRGYMLLAHALLSSHTKSSCIDGCLGASSTDNFPGESIQNTLEPRDRLGEWPPSYWSSGGQVDPGASEFLVYKLCSDLCLIDEIRIHPFKAFFQERCPIYSSQYVRFKFGCPKVPLQHKDLVSEVNEGQLIADNNYIWVYTSSEFPMLQKNVLQSFKLPRPVLCIGGVVKVEFLGRVQKQWVDDQYYICISHVQVLGTPLPGELQTAAYENGIALKYYPDHEPLEDNGWQIWRALIGNGQGIGFNQEMLSRLLGPQLQLAVEENGHGELKEVNQALP